MVIEITFTGIILCKLDWGKGTNQVTKKFSKLGLVLRFFSSFSIKVLLFQPPGPSLIRKVSKRKANDKSGSMALFYKPL